MRLEGKTAGVEIKRTAAPKHKETREIKYCYYTKMECFPAGI